MHRSTSTSAGAAPGIIVAVGKPFSANAIRPIGGTCSRVSALGIEADSGLTSQLAAGAGVSGAVITAVPRVGVVGPVPVMLAVHAAAAVVVNADAINATVCRRRRRGSVVIRVTSAGCGAVIRADWTTQAARFRRDPQKPIVRRRAPRPGRPARRRRC
ncbi:hypothetical protein BHQ19_32010 [Mycolicibacterium porcinum]|nr:hypothetical protein BHQ19_32010 [Mycolicibacterium porcinum]